MSRKAIAWRRRRTTPKTTEDFSDNPVGNRSRGLELDLRLREFEINQLTQRNNFFMIFQGVLIAGLIQSQGTAAPLITFGMSLLGFATSLLQIGMAGGAKYWQSRWEASTRSSEIAIVLELVKQNKVPVQTFTHDLTLLTEDERDQIRQWNQHNPNDQISDGREFIRQIVKTDIESRRKSIFFRLLDWWVCKLAIMPKWSVSRIPIWIGGFLLVFWATIALNCVRIPSIGLDKIKIDWFELVPLKSDSPSK